MCVWDVATGKHVHEAFDPTRQVTRVAFSPDGAQLVTASLDGTVHVWDVATWSRLKVLNEVHDGINYPMGGISMVAFSPDGKLFAGESGIIRMWETTGWQVIRDLEGHDGTISSLCFSPDGQLLASSSYDHTARVWDVATGQLVHEIDDHGINVNQVSFSPDGRFLATVAYDHTARVWDVSTWACLHVFESVSKSTYNVRFSPGSRYLAIGAWGDAGRIWDMNTDELVASFPKQDRGTHDYSFAPDGRCFAYIGSKTLFLWTIVLGDVVDWRPAAELTEDQGAF